jgi:antirestriction protein ArdC
MSTKKDIYERLTEIAVAGLKSKGLQWFKPWTNAAGEIEAPINNLTQHPYKGLNVWLLTAAMIEGGYECNEWLTYKQAAERNGQVRKGEKSTPVIFWMVGYRDADGKWYGSSKAVLAAGKRLQDCDKTFNVREYKVFNIAQCDSIEARRKVAKIEDMVPLTDDEQFDACHEVFKGWSRRGNVPTITNLHLASYSPSTDTICMPPAETFSQGWAGYYFTLFHEMIHSTGHETRLDRFKPSNEVEGAYAKEELVAEMGAQFLATTAGLEYNRDQTQAYINGWCKALTDKPKWIVYGASQAQKAVELILGEEKESV